MKNTTAKRNWQSTVLGSVGLFWLLLVAVLPAPAYAQSQGSSSALKELQQLRSEVARLQGNQASSEKELKELKAKIDETGWKALDFATQVSSTQWAMFGTGLAIIGLIITVAALGAYQGLLRLLETKLEDAAAKVEKHLEQAMQTEEARLRGEMDRRVNGIKGKYPNFCV